MRSIRAFLFRLTQLFRIDRERDLADEIESHLQMAIEDHIRSGMTPAEAQRAAVIDSGGVESAKDAYRDRRGFPLLEHFVQDVRYTLRTLRKNPGFAITALLTLALGIGANTAMFSLVDAFLLRSLPVRNPQELIVIRGAFPYSTFEHFRDRSHSFSGMFAFDESHVTVTIDGQPEYVDGDFVSGSYYGVLGVHAIAGRTFRPDDDQPGQPPVAVISHQYWDQRFAGEPSTIGKTIYLAGMPCTIVGVTPGDFFGTNVAGKSPDIVLPMSMHDRLALKDHDAVVAIARLRSGVSIEAAQADLNGLYRQLLTDGRAISPQLEREVQAKRIELRSGVRGLSNSGGAFAVELRILTGVVGIALAMTCVNIANLLLAKATGRHKAIAVRLSIGASRGRLIRQLLTESAVLGLTGGCLGLLVAKGSLDVLLTVLSYGQGSIPFELNLDSRVLVFTIGVSLIAGILFGLAPALAAARYDPGPILKGDGHGVSRPLHLGLIHLLVVVQVALSLVLLIASGLMIRSLQALHDVDFGFERNTVVTAWVFPALAGYDHMNEVHLYRSLPDRMKAIPGVVAASLLRVRMLRGGWYRNVWAQSSEIVPEQNRKVRCTQAPPEHLGQMNLMVRSAASTGATVSAMRRELHSIDPNLPLVGAQTQADEIDDVFGRHRSLATLLSIFGIMTLMLTMIGLHGTMSHAVTRRTKELGIRTALGAQKGAIRSQRFDTNSLGPFKSGPGESGRSAVGHGNPGDRSGHVQRSCNPRNVLRIGSLDGNGQAIRSVAKVLQCAWRGRVLRHQAGQVYGP